MAKFKKKPVTIEAWRYNNDPAGEEMPPWLVDAIAGGTVLRTRRDGDRRCLAIKTLEGEMCAFIGDWIIQGVEGEIYPCKPQIFEATYSPVKEKA